MPCLRLSWMAPCYTLMPPQANFLSTLRWGEAIGDCLCSNAHDVSFLLTIMSTIAAAMLTADVRGSRPREEIVRDVSQRLPWRTVPEVSRLRRHGETYFPRAVVARAGLKETLSALHARGMHLGMVPNGEGRCQEPKITQLSMGRSLSTVVMAEAVQVQKPDPRMFAHALAAIGCAAIHTWFVGDHPIHDVLGAAAVGLRPMWLTGVQPWPPEHPAPRWQIAALGELLTMG